MTRNSSLSKLTILILTIVFLTSCQEQTVSDEQYIIAAPTQGSIAEDGTIFLPDVNPLTVKGQISIAGSSTVYPLSEKMAERFQDEGFSDKVTIASIGSGAGFERFCKAGETDIANASRPIKQSEIDHCHAIGRNPIEIRIGTDALAIIVSKENDFLTNVTLEQLALIFSSAKNWSDVDPSWPNKPIARFIPGTDSGTFDYFIEELYDKDATPILSAANLQMSEDDNILVRGVGGSPYSIGFLGYAYYEENAAELKIIDVEGIEPKAATIDDNSYPLARPLYMYTTLEIMKNKPQVGAFISFFLTYVNEEILEVGYFPANPEELNHAKELIYNTVQ